MPDVFILGAGFSVAISPTNMPTTDELGDRVVRYLQSLHRSDPAIKHSERCDGLSCDRPELIAGKIPAPTFEIWMSRLAEQQPYLYPNENFYASARFHELSVAIAHEVRSATDATCAQHVPSPDWPHQLVGSWHEKRCDVLTFNYDTLVESLVDHNLGKDYYRKVGPPLVPAPPSFFGGGRAWPADTFRYVKLHGSIHWYWDTFTRSAESMVEIGLPSRWDYGSNDHWNPNYTAPGKRPVVVPPVVIKTGFFDNPIVRRTWLVALEAITHADHLYIVGYSMPEHDLLVASLLTEAATRRGPIPTSIVNLTDDVIDRVESTGIVTPGANFIGADAIAEFTASYAAGV